MGRKTTDPGFSENEVQREHQKKIKRTLKRLRAAARRQSKILAGKAGRLFSKKAIRDSLVESIRKRFGDKVQFRKSALNTITSIGVSRVMRELGQVRDHSVHNCRTSLTEADARFVLHGECNPIKVGFKALVG